MNNLSFNTKTAAESCRILLTIQKKHPNRCKPDSVPLCNGGNHLSVRPEPGAVCAASNGSPPIWSCCGRSLPCGDALTVTRWALTPPFHPYRLAAAVCSLLHWSFRGISSTAPLFSKGLPALCSPDFPQRKYSRRDCPRSRCVHYINITIQWSICKNFSANLHNIITLSLL